MKKLRYLKTISAGTLLTNALFLGTAAAPFSRLYTQRGLAFYFTCPSANGSTSFEPVLINTVMTAAGQVGGRVRINMSTNVVLGGWANALKAQVECNTNGRATGLLSAFCAEMVMPASDISGLGGSYAALEVEVRTPASSVASRHTAFAFFGTGGDDTAIAAFIAAGSLFELIGMGTPTDDTEGLWHLTKDVAPTHALRCIIDNVHYDILMVASVYSSD